MSIDVARSPDAAYTWTEASGQLFSVGSSGLEHHALVSHWDEIGKIDRDATYFEKRDPVDRIAVMSGSASAETAAQLDWASEHGFRLVLIETERLVEPSEEGRERLAERGVSAVGEDRALNGADIVILAVPDDLIGPVSEDIVPKLDSGTMVVLLDPAAAYTGALCEREDVSFFITHPAHPSIVETTSELSNENPDWFGGQGREEQDIVCALHRGPSEDYERGEALARDIYGPVRRAHELTTEQMVLLEPALVEMVLGSCLYTVREACEHVIDMGVPEQAARDFLFGHFRVELGIVFGFTDSPSRTGHRRPSKRRNGTSSSPTGKNGCSQKSDWTR